MLRSLTLTSGAIPLLSKISQDLFYFTSTGANPPAVRMFGAQRHILLDSQMRRQHEFLVNHADAGIASVQRIGRRIRLAVQGHASRIGLVCAAQYLHERAFPGAVLAYQRMHLARPYVQVHAPERMHRAERFSDALKAKHGR